MTCLFKFSGLRIVNYLNFTFTFFVLADGNEKYNYLYLCLGWRALEIPLTDTVPLPKCVILDALGGEFRITVPLPLPVLFPRNWNGNHVWQHGNSTEPSPLASLRCSMIPRGSWLVFADSWKMLEQMQARLRAQRCQDGRSHALLEYLGLAAIVRHAVCSRKTIRTQQILLQILCTFLRDSETHFKTPRRREICGNSADKSVQNSAQQNQYTKKLRKNSGHKESVPKDLRQKSVWTFRLFPRCSDLKSLSASEIATKIASK